MTNAEGSPIRESSSRVKLAEGKTKAIWNSLNSNQVIIESKDDITAGDGLKKDTISGKAEIATETTCNVFEALQKAGLRTHYIERGQDNRSFIAQRLEMIPLEVVIRNIATGSYLQRNPDTKDGYQFEQPVVEFYYKDDSLHDPIVEFDQNGWANLFDAHKPKGEPIKRIKLADMNMTLADSKTMEKTALLVNEVLKENWEQQDVTMVDIKIEFGLNSQHQLLVGDVVDNDSWRLWPGGEKGQMLDKQVYRNIVEKPTPEQIGEIKSNYARVAEMTRKFLH